MLYFLMTLLSFAQEPDHSIKVVASGNLEVYVAPIEILNYTKDIEAIVGEASAFGYVSSDTRHAKIFNGIYYEPILLNTSGFKTYSKDTIKYAWDNCDYIKDPKECANQNDHFLLETHITIDDNQLVVAMYLYDSDLQIISHSTVTSDKIIKWIKQQQVTVAQQGAAYRSQPQSNCSSCPQVSGVGSNQQNTLIHKPVEGLPLKWEIPHRLMDKHINQASLSLWLSTRIK